MQGLRTVAGFLTVLFAVVTVPAAVAAYVSGGIGVALWVVTVGWLLLTPAVAVLAGYLSNPVERLERVAKSRVTPTNQSDSSPINHDQAEDPLDGLRRQYAAGAIDEQELERRLETVLGTGEQQAGDTGPIENTLEGAESTVEPDGRHQLQLDSTDE